MSFPAPFYRWRPHPWHGLERGPDAPRVVHAYIEITPFDLVKYEVDKATGYTRVDRPQRFTSQTPTLYGFVPRTICTHNVGKLCPGAQGGDNDPLDICVVSERPINRADVVLNARVVGGLQILDHGEADDKIVAVLSGDNVWGDVGDIGDLPPVLIERLRHYFWSYKAIPDGGSEQPIEIRDVYGVEHALRVVEASIADYDIAYGG